MPLFIVISLLLNPPANPAILSVPVAVAAPLTKEDLIVLASTTARAYGLNVDHFIKTIGCESQWNPEAVGDNGTSFGLAQLHYPSRDWGIATSSAFDPYTAIQIMAKAWQQGFATRWSCYNILYERNWKS